MRPSLTLDQRMKIRAVDAGRLKDETFDGHSRQCVNMDHNRWREYRTQYVGSAVERDLVGQWAVCGCKCHVRLPV